MIPIVACITLWEAIPTRPKPIPWPHPKPK
jgi:hypothetical protein